MIFSIKGGLIMELKKGLISGIIAAIVLSIIYFILMMVTNTGEWYSITFPEMMTTEAMWTGTFSIVLIGIFMGLIYSVINSAVPGMGTRKGLNYGFMVWLLAGVMWPIMMIAFAPFNIWIIELISGLISYSITGVIIAIIYEKL
jgi:uncharacterized membrane protein YagU involved in acid resistance